MSRIPTWISRNQKSKSVRKDAEYLSVLFVKIAGGMMITNATGAAEILQIKPTTFESRIAQLGIKRPAKAEVQASHLSPRECVNVKRLEESKKHL